ncbi:facilitated trehalose transporter Tret1-2 homolog [Bacillus rossius redtenbacheri]|uniref:facilitated trehalose transporter Tret1-2 homolog n=1 Tax=Bacillus rossius redtenbacheri TaxID=93214 RepID=UPI002FDCDBEF
MEATQKQGQKSRKLPQYFAGVVAVVNTVTAGCVFGWTSPALPHLQAPADNSSASAGGLTVDEGSLVGSLVAVGALAGSLPTGHLANLLGRRRLSQALSLLLVAGWAVIAVCGRQVVYLCAARLLQGACLGAGSVVTPLYNEEISEVGVRGSLGVLYDSALCLGILWVYLAGALAAPYLWMNVSCALPAALSFLLLFLVPESPVHLLARGDEAAARAALTWLRGGDPDVGPELESLRRLVQRPATPGRCAWTPPTAKALLIVTGLMMARQLSGINAVTFYAEDILRASGAGMEPSIAAMLCAVFELAVTVLMVVIADLAGRRLLLAVSCWGSALCLAGLALAPPGWLPVASVLGYIGLFSVGLGPLPWFMMAELVPTEAKGWVTGVAATVNWLAMFLVTQFFVGLVRALGPAGTYAGYAAVNGLAGAGVLLFVPETRGKSLEDIQKELAGVKPAAPPDLGEPPHCRPRRED